MIRAWHMKGYGVCMVPGMVNQAHRITYIMCCTYKEQQLKLEYSHSEQLAQPGVLQTSRA